MRLIAGYWNPKKIGVATHFFEIISVESKQNAEKRRKEYFFTKELEFAFTYRKANTITKILKLLG